MKRFLLLFAVMFIAGLCVNAQTNQPPCSTEQARQFDFWVGTWNLEWADAKGTKLSGTNTITKILNGCAIEENFSTAGSSPFIGKSLSLFDARNGRWKQTWVDNAGAYLDFVGEFKDGKMTLSREAVNPQGKKIMQRMVFSEIKKDSIRWDWESSVDDGKTWTSNWQLNYKRKTS